MPIRKVALYGETMHRHRRHPAHSHHGEHDHHHGDSHALILELDARIHRPHLDDLVERAAAVLRRDPATVADLGAGTGAATFALADRFPHACLLAVDNSADMLARLRNTAQRNGTAARIDTIEADLDAGLPDPGPLDLAWAASSLHHIDDPGTLLVQVHDALRPGGVLVVTEMEGHPRFLPDDIGIGRPGLEARCHRAVATKGWNTYPDWSVALGHAGFTVAEHRRIEIDIDPAPPTVNDYAYELLRRMRQGLDDALEPDDLELLDHLTDRHGPDSVLDRNDLTVRGARIVWIARKSEESR